MKPAEFFYNILIHLGLPVAATLTLAGFRGRRPLKRLQQKFKLADPGVLDPPVEFWLHGASVGEMVLVKRTRDWLLKLGVQEEEILISAQTATGLKNITHPRRFILPHDYPWLIGAASRRAAANWLLIMETELWPNFYRYNSGRVVLMNGKIKNKNFWKYKAIKPLLKETLDHCRRIMARSGEDANRFKQLAPGLDVSSTGSFKWLTLIEEPPELPPGPRFRSNRKTLVAGSTWPGEEEKALNLSRRFDLDLYLAPRHLKRLQKVEELLDESGLEWCRWSAGEKTYGGEVVLVDKMGVLAGIYGYADLAFVGGSWDEQVGGHNLLEPVQWTKPVLTGPYLQNVEITAAALEEAGLLFRASGDGDWQKLASQALTQSADKIETGVKKLRARARQIEADYRQLLRELIDR